MAVAVAELRDPRSVERDEREQARANFLWGQPGMFDRGKVCGELDNCSSAAVVIAPTGCSHWPPTVSAGLRESLAADATVQAVLMDGARPVTVTKRCAPNSCRVTSASPSKRATALTGSPVLGTHGTRASLRKGREGHHVDQLAGLAGPSHRRVHRCGWQITLDTGTGEMTFTRGDRSWTTLPHGTRLRRPPPGGQPPG